MVKRALAGIPALLLLTTLAACGDDSSGSTAKDTEAPDSSASAQTTDATTDAATEDSTAAAGECTYTPDGTSSDVKLPPSTPSSDKPVQATVASSIGSFEVTLDAKNAPCTVNSFISLAEQGFYDGTPCHRLTVSAQFKVLQCGDPTGTGTGGPGYTIPDEYDGTETYGAGTLAMARTQAPNSGGSQFFIVYGDTALDPSYTVFGTVEQAGIDAITEAAKKGVEPQMGPEDGAPKTKIDIESVTVK